MEICLYESVILISSISQPHSASIEEKNDRICLAFCLVAMVISLKRSSDGFLSFLEVIQLWQKTNDTGYKMLITFQPD